MNRDVASKLLTAAPGLDDAAVSHRAILARGVRFLVEQGVRQLVDLGSGLPDRTTVITADMRAPEAVLAHPDLSRLVDMDGSSG